MAVRHRIPTIFSIYMVDVLCCALGCVILLWQVSHQEAEDQTKTVLRKNDELSSSLERLASAKLAIDSLTSDVANLRVALDSATKRAVSVTLELDDTRSKRDAAEKLALVRKKDYDALKETHELAAAALEALRVKHVELTKTSADLDKRATLTAAELAQRVKENADLLLRLSAAERSTKALEKDLSARELALSQAGKRADDASGKLAELERLAQLLGREKLELLAKLKVGELRARTLELDLGRAQSDSQKKITDLLRDSDSLNAKLMLSAKDLESLRAALAGAVGENQKLAATNRAVRLAAENRFAGITLTGKKVVFMVDMSGSMELLDEKTPQPDKWPLVCDTLAKIMQSLTGLEQYQIVLFSEKTTWPMGNDGKWLDYRSADDAQAVAATLKRIRPKGATDMHSAFQEAFRLRESGLDTVYVLSDGLPNAGAGMPANAAQLTEQQITSALARHVRQTLLTDWNRLIAERRVRINTVGFFFESPDVGAFLWALAREHDGSFVGMSRP